MVSKPIPISGISDQIKWYWNEYYFLGKKIKVINIHIGLNHCGTVIVTNFVRPVAPWYCIYFEAWVREGGNWAPQVQTKETPLEGRITVTFLPSSNLVVCDQKHKAFLRLSEQKQKLTFKSFDQFLI